MRLADGPPGVMIREPATALPATMALAATFSAHEGVAAGEVIGRDARALGVAVTLQPYINLYRDPADGRAYNTYGEDPVLCGIIGAAVIQGIQSQGVMAQAKHFVAYDGSTAVRVDGQALRELYAAPFQDAIDAGVASMMGAYNRVNGTYACGSRSLLTDLLRGEMGFEGFVTSDWGAVHGTEYLLAGTDMEMPGTKLVAPGLAQMHTYYATAEHSTANLADLIAGGSCGSTPEEAEHPGSAVIGPVQATDPGLSRTIKEALLRGTMAEADITLAARRVLGQMLRFGFLDGNAPCRVLPQSIEQNAAVAQRIAERSATLLKNDGMLPLAPASLSSLALIGAGATQAVTIGRAGEKALGHVGRHVSPHEAIARTSTKPPAQIRLAMADDMEGIPIAAGHWAAPGLRRSHLGGSSEVTFDATLDFTSSNGCALGPDSSLRWDGMLKVVEAGDYDINLQILGGTGRLSVDGELRGVTTSREVNGGSLQALQDNVLPTRDGLNNLRRRIHLSAGLHRVIVETGPDGSHQPLQVRLNWVVPQRRTETWDEAIAAARESHTALVFAWGRNRPILGLPGRQNELIEAVAAVNANTCVVLNVSDPIAMPWLDKVRAVLLMWYPGDEGGWATANVLLGRVNPGGRLPFTWIKSLDQNVAHDPRHPERSAKGTNGVTDYSEGLLIGYRWADSQHLDPLFPFGYGLSYTRFDYGELLLERDAENNLTVRVAIRNVGTVAGDEVPQVYLLAPAMPEPGVQFAPRVLVGFERVTLGPGAERQLAIHVPERRLQHWDEALHRWQLCSQPRVIEVGPSSREARLQALLAPLDVESP